MSLHVDADTMLVIDKVLKQLAPKYTFDNYDVDDMYQVGFMIIVNKLLKAYKPDKGTSLSTFLYTALGPRYINFIRDHSVRSHNHCKQHTDYVESCPACKRRQATQDKKRGIQKPRDLDGLDFPSNNIIDEVEIKELENKINKLMPKEMRTDYLLMKEGSYVSRSRKNEIENFIREIIDE